jgi:DNA-binding transcriptional LysR family regulator
VFRQPTSGKLESWPLVRDGMDLNLELPVAAVASTVEARLYLAEQGFGVACLPPYAVRQQASAGTLVELLDGYVRDTGTLSLLWPTSRYLSPKIRAFVDFMAEHLTMN